MNRSLATIPLLAAALTLAACSSAVPASQTLLAPASAAATESTPPSPTAAAYSNTQACTAFTDATTIGIPANANAPAGTSTMTWLASQEGSAQPWLKVYISEYTLAWAVSPPDVAMVNNLTRKIDRICTGA